MRYMLMGLYCKLQVHNLLDYHHYYKADIQLLSRGFVLFLHDLNAIMENMLYIFELLLQVKPLVSPTKAIMSVHINTYAWQEFFPQCNNK